MKKQQTKSITAIATTVNNHKTYISGQSTRYDGKLLPNYNTDPVHAKEFDGEQDAQTYLSNVANPLDRVFEILTIDIPVIKDLKKYDRDNKRQLTGHRYQGGIREGARIRGLISIIVLIVITSCSKSQLPQPKQSYAVYHLYAEHYTLDTLFIKKYTLWHDTLFRKQEQQKLDTIPPRWYLMCTTEKLPLRLEYWYYTRNGIKIQ